MKIFKNYKTLLIAFVLTFVGVGSVMGQKTAYISRGSGVTSLSEFGKSGFPSETTQELSGNDFKTHLSLEGCCYTGQYFTLTLTDFRYEVTSINVICRHSKLASDGDPGYGTFTYTSSSDTKSQPETLSPTSGDFDTYTVFSGSLAGLKSATYTHANGSDKYLQGRWVAFQAGTGSSSFLQITYYTPTISIEDKTLDYNTSYTLKSTDVKWEHQGAFTYDAITLTKSSSTCVSISADGKTLTSESAGTATITATLTNNGTAVATTTFDVEVKDYTLDATIDFGIAGKTSFDDGKKDVVIFKREFKEGQWTTLALPFDVTLSQLNKTFKYASVCELASITRMDIKGGKIYYRTQDHLKANEPVLAYIKPNDDNLYKFEGVTLVPPTAEQLTHTVTEGVQLVPVYKKTNYTVYNDIQNNLWFLYGGKFYDWSYLSDMYPFQAYIYNATASSGAKSFTFVPEGYVETSISGAVISMPENSTNNAIYNIAGQRVNSNAKGLLIKNGKKIFVK